MGFRASPTLNPQIEFRQVLEVHLESIDPSSILYSSSSSSELVLGELFGAGIFVSTAVAGAVCLTTPFKIMERPFLRDVTFNIVAGYWAFCIFYR